MAVLTALTLAPTLYQWARFRERLGLALTSGPHPPILGPADGMTTNQLFECLLSGNLAVSLGDDFRQLESGLSDRRAEGNLALHWGIDSREICRRVVGERLTFFGATTCGAKRAIDTWYHREDVDLDEKVLIEEAYLYLALHANLAHEEAPCHDPLSMLAWDIQQLAVIVRLSLKLAYIDRHEAEAILRTLAEQARSGFRSWKDFSLCAMVGLGMSGSIALFDTNEWAWLASTHAVFLDKHSPIKCVHWVKAEEQHAGAQGLTLKGEPLVV